MLIEVCAYFCPIRCDLISEFNPSLVLLRWRDYCITTLHILNSSSTAQPTVSKLLFLLEEFCLGLFQLRFSIFKKRLILFCIIFIKAKENLYSFVRVTLNFVKSRNYLLRRYILSVLMHTTAWNQH